LLELRQDTLQMLVLALDLGDARLQFARRGLDPLQGISTSNEGSPALAQLDLDLTA
jgi:hypothetical protein